MRIYSKGNIKLVIPEERKEDVKDVAKELRDQVQLQDLKLPIDCAAMLNAFLAECGVFKD